MSYLKQKWIKLKQDIKFYWLMLKVSLGFDIGPKKD